MNWNYNAELLSPNQSLHAAAYYIIILTAPASLMMWKYIMAAACDGFIFKVIFSKDRYNQWWIIFKKMKLLRKNSKDFQDLFYNPSLNVSLGIIFTFITLVRFQEISIQRSMKPTALRYALKKQS